MKNEQWKEYDELNVNMGPQHPSTHGVLRLLLRTDGEIVKEAIPHIGYLHRSIEMIAEKINYSQFMPYTDRLDYLAAMNNNLAYALTVEKLMGIEVPERAQYIRVIMAELNRIASHLVAIGTFGLDLGVVTPFFYAFREREYILDLFEMCCGARLTYNYMRIGGVANDLPPGFMDRLRDFLDYFVPRVEEYNQLMSFNKIFIERTAGIGVLPPDVAINYGVTGPNLRGSGVKWDLRKDVPYCIYPRFEFNIPVGSGMVGKVGDSWDRYWVRVQEMLESVKIIRQAMEQIPAGEVRAKLPRLIKPPVGEVFFRAENPRGELGFYIVSDGSPNPYRLKIRAPSFCNLSVFEEISKDWMIADLVAILGSLDIVLGEIDR
uniref:NADH dehydrogenase I subunit D n=1 Tax=uncultured prokaryote TaxID=198431 RepID=H5SP97_9ZZZZ|nr:NADH dehydrogenase I subunit D [uncultured prokaryote]